MAKELNNIQVLDNKGFNDNRPTMVKKAPMRLGNIRAVRREMANVYSEARRGIIEEQKATKLVYILATLCNTIRDSELEQRIEELESNDKS